jgi:hypothetical protein
MPEQNTRNKRHRAEEGGQGELAQEREERGGSAAGGLGAEERVVRSSTEASAVLALYKGVCAHLTLKSKTDSRQRKHNELVLAELRRKWLEASPRQTVSKTPTSKAHPKKGLAEWLSQS